MKNLGKIFITFILIVNFINANSANNSVKSSVNTTEVVLGNPIQLKIQAIGDDIEFPNITNIDGYKTMTTTSSSYGMSIINGKKSVEYKKSLIITFLPTKNVTIPSYIIKVEGREYKTNPISIKVLKASAPTNNTNQQFSLVMKTDNPNPIVGQSFMVKLYLYLRRDVQISQNIQFTPPAFNGFSAKRLKDIPAYVKGNYQIQEIRYVVTPSVEGNMTISPATVKIAISQQKRDMFGFNIMFNGSWKSTTSNGLKINVLPQTQNSDIVGDFKISKSIDQTSIKANKPIKMIVNIEGYGDLENFEYQKYEIDDVTIYSDDATIKTEIRNNKLYTKYSKSFVFIADNNFTIPKREITALNPQTQKVKTLKVDSQDIIVKNRHQISNPNIVQTNLSNTPKTKIKEVIVNKEIKTTNYYLVALAYLLGILSILLFKYLKTINFNRKSYNEKEALSLLYPHITKDKDIEEMVKKLYKKQRGDKSVVIDKKELREMCEGV